MTEVQVIAPLRKIVRTEWIGWAQAYYNFLGCGHVIPQNPRLHGNKRRCEQCLDVAIAKAAAEKQQGELPL